MLPGDPFARKWLRAPATTKTRASSSTPAGGIIASGEVFEELRRDTPRLADEFHPHDAAFIVPGADGMTVATYVVPPAPPAAATSEQQFSCSPARADGP
jgi:hypothetical protein